MRHRPSAHPLYRFGRDAKSYNSPSMAPPSGQPARETWGLADQSMKKPILVFLIASNPFLKALRLVAPTICWSSIFHVFTTLVEKKYFRQSGVHLILLNFSVWPLVPLLLLSSVNKSWSPIIDLPEISWKPLSSPVCSFFPPVSIILDALASLHNLVLPC